MRLLALASLAGLLVAAPNDKKIDSAVKRITNSAILIDTHNDIPSFTVDGADIGNSPNTHTDIKRLRAGGVGAIFFSVYVSASYVNGNHSANRELQMIDTVYHDILDRHPNDLSTGAHRKRYRKGPSSAQNCGSPGTRRRTRH